MAVGEPQGILMLIMMITAPLEEARSLENSDSRVTGKIQRPTGAEVKLQEWQEGVAGYQC